MPGWCSSGEPDHHPFDVVADGVEGGTIRLDAGTSSQFLTALLLVAPLFRTGLTIEVTDLVSVPYVGITLAMMRDFGVEVEVHDRTYIVPLATYRARTYQVEPDASSASYFFAAAAVLGRTVTVPGLGAGRAAGRPRSSSGCSSRWARRCGRRARRRPSSAGGCTA